MGVCAAKDECILRFLALLGTNQFFCTNQVSFALYKRTFIVNTLIAAGLKLNLFIRVSRNNVFL
jgi:hypothetical protein